MADNGFKINKSVNLNPQASAPANPVDGDIYYDSTAQSFAYYHNGSWANFDSVGTVASSLWLTAAQFTSTVVRNSVVKVTGAVALSHLAGIAASFSAKRITIHNAGTFTIVVEPEDANEGVANNRIQTPTGGSMNLVAGEIAVFMYDIVASRWLLVSISSNAGAQVIATTANPGLVTLHKASLLPLDGVVLSDGDLNTANGVVGLDANRAATIGSPSAAVDALTLYSIGAPNYALRADGEVRIDANGPATALTVNALAVGGTNEVALFQRTGAYDPYIKVSNGSSSFIATLSNTQGVLLGTGGSDNIPIRFYIQGTERWKIDNTNSRWASTSMYLDPSATPAIRGANGLVLRLGANDTDFWEVSTTGTLQGVSTNRKIANVLDPTGAQDAATKNYVDTTAVLLTTNQSIAGIKSFTDRVSIIDIPGAGNANLRLECQETTNSANALYATSTSVGATLDIRNTSTGSAINAVVSAASSNAAVRAVHADGYAVECIAKTATPIKAPLRITPQDNPPSSGVMGDLYVDSVTGKLYIYTTSWTLVGSQT